MNSFKLFIFYLIIFLSISSCKDQNKVIKAVSWKCKIDGSKSWKIPETPNGLKPSQCWFSIGSSPDGNIYIGACDHETNSALYKLDTKNDILTYVGDAKSASEEVKNWLPDETAEKFHVRPIYYNGKIYVATADFSYLTDTYLHKRGFHWYSYDILNNKFTDLSIKDPNGISGEHASIMAIAIDYKNEYIYAIDSPRGLLFRYNIKKGTTENLGRPKFLTEDYYTTPGRYIWIDSDGKVYFTLSQFINVLFYDPVKKFFAGYSDWELKNIFYTDKNLRAGQWSIDGKRCYLTDYEGNFYLFNDEDKSFNFIGKGSGPIDHYYNQQAFKIRVFNVSADEKKIYFTNDDSKKFSLFEFDINTKKTVRLCYLSDIDNKFKGRKYFNKAGNDSWDNDGRFYITSFGHELVNTTDVIVTRIDPVLLKVNLGIINLTKINISKIDDKIIITRTGDLSQDLEILVSIKENENDIKNNIKKIKLQSQINRFEVKIEKLINNNSLPNKSYIIKLIPNGNNYKTGVNNNYIKL